jgi:DNA-binding transcriptional LysR family regulator
MQLHQFEYVLAVAKYRSFTRAAKEIKISQSSLSQQISNLEKELGVTLFIRTTRSVYLTAAGEDFVSHAANVMADINATRKCMQEYVSIDKGHLTIGIIPVVGHYPIPKLLASFNREFPGVKLSLIENQDEELLDMLCSSMIDAVFVQRTSNDVSIDAFPMYTDQMVLITNTAHALAFRKSVNLKELRKEKFIITPPVSGHYQDLEKACADVGFEPKIFMTCSSVETILGLTKEGVGITALSREVARKMAGGDELLSIIPLTPVIERKIFMCIQKNVNISPVLKMFVKFMAQWISSSANTAAST